LVSVSFLSANGVKVLQLYSVIARKSSVCGGLEPFGSEWVVYEWWMEWFRVSGGKLRVLGWFFKLIDWFLGFSIRFVPKNETTRTDGFQVFGFGFWVCRFVWLLLSLRTTKESLSAVAEEVYYNW
jgi:hypothetical protein